MEKAKTYRDVYFAADDLDSAIKLFQAIANADPGKSDLCSETYETSSKGIKWSYDSLPEFYADYRAQPEHCYLTINNHGYRFRIQKIYADTIITIECKTRGQIEHVFEIFEKAFPTAKLPETHKEPLQLKPKIFIGHGRKPLWHELKDHLQDKHHFEVIAYEVGARAGHTIRDILEDMLTQSSLALLVMTGEDENADGTLKARQNVIHEIGLFQGRLGFSRAIVLIEDGVDEFSNLHGIEQIRFNKNNIRETFGEVLAVLFREFPSI
jgi:predicted nucleotide-binding protein